MGPLIWHSKPELRNPVFIGAFGGWADAQEAATSSARYLVHSLEATKFAELDSEDFYVFTRMRPMVMMDDQGKRFIRWPANEFYFWKNPKGGSDLIIFVGLEPQIHWKTYCNLLLEVIEAYQTKPTLLLGAFLDGTPHTRVPVITGTGSTPQLREVFAEAGIFGARQRPTYQGPTGISTAFTLECEARGREYGMLWGHAPHYLQTSPNPKVTHSIMQSLLKFMPLPVSLDPLLTAAGGFEAEVSKALANNLELQAYVRRLEQQYDGGLNAQAPQQSSAQQQTSTGGQQEELPSPDAVLKDLEDFLRRRQPGDQGQSGQSGPVGPA